MRRPVSPLLVCAAALALHATTSAPAAAQDPARTRDPSAADAAAADAVRDAQLAGAAHPRAAAPVRVASGFGPDRWSGTADRKCVEASGAGPVRSGEFIIGGQLGGSRPLTARRQAKIWWAPLHNAIDMDTLVVRGRSLSGSGSDTVRLAFGNIAWPVAPGAPPVPATARDYFFPSGTTIPSPGRWLLVAASGSNWGCFILHVR